jgi:pyruvate,orthophosphate dikinase
MSERWVYGFDELPLARAAVGGDWDEVRGLLGGKAANLADMVELGVPVPPGFTITTRACNEYSATGRFPDGMWEEVVAALGRVEAALSQRYGGDADPLLVAVRSGAKFSMPGMMDTVLDVGQNDDVVAAMTARTGDERFALDCYRRLIQMFSTVVLEVEGDAFEDRLRAERDAAGAESDSELPVDVLRDVVAGFLSHVVEATGRPFPSDPYEQLRLAIEAVFRSWGSKRATDYRRAAGIPDDLGTAVTVVAMVYGNTGQGSGTGVAMSRDATTGEARLEGDYLINAQGEDVVAGNRATRPLTGLAEDLPEAASELAEIAQRLERHHRDMQDMEFTVEDGKLWLLQTRTGKRTAQAAVRIAVDMAQEQLITREEAVRRITPDQLEVLLHPRFSPAALAAAVPLGTGLNVSPGAAVGMAVFDPDRAEQWAAEGRDVVLVRHETKPDDVHGMLAAVGVLTASGGRTSHAALVARQFGKPAVTGAAGVVIDVAARSFTVGSAVVREGDWLSLDGSTGAFYAGRLDTSAAELDDPWLTTILGWADELRRLEVRANADEADDAALARSFGATGIGLCRTEHMFFAPERLPIVQRMIMAADDAAQKEAIESLRQHQREDFLGLLRVMGGLPVKIRLLDPPLHEFLPSWEDLQRRSTALELALAEGGDAAARSSLERELADTRALLARVESLREANPMLGLRGVRLGLKMPDLIRMQTTSIIEAALAVAAEGGDPRPEIMVPLVGHANELAAQRKVIDEAADAAMTAAGRRVRYTVGTMIEVPRAALTAAAIAEHADFLSFGTNDLTQMTYGISRDDAEAGFLRRYIEEGILPDNPFSTIDRDGVGRLMEIAVEEARRARPGIECGICGEHGGDPASIELCEELGLAYVSCSSYRVPVARLAAAHAALAAVDRQAGEAGGTTP